MKKEPPVLVSSCLLGINCRYDGRHALCPGLADFVGRHPFIPFCPEQLGGLPTPRPPALIRGGDGENLLEGAARVVDIEGNDVSDAFERGAQQALRLARLGGVRLAIMKDRSPSCGLHTPYCDMPSGAGVGVAAALFEANGIIVVELGADDRFPTESFSALIKS